MNPVEKAAQTGTAIGQAIKLDPEKAYMTWQGPDALLSRAVASAGDPTPLPLPGPRPVPRGLLPAPPAQLGAPMGTQYNAMMGEEPTPTTGDTPPAWQQNQWQGIGAPKQLPAGTAPFTQGVIVPDIAGGSPRTYNAGLLPPPQPGVPPTNVLPRGPSSVQGRSYMPSSAGNARPAPPAGSSDLLDQPVPRMIAGPEPPAWGGARPIRIAPSSGQPYPAAPVQPSGPTPPPTGNSLATQMGKQIWNALGGPPVQ
jgi:hypothetical protein